MFIHRTTITGLSDRGAPWRQPDRVHYPDGTGQPVPRASPRGIGDE